MVITFWNDAIEAYNQRYMIDFVKVKQKLQKEILKDPNATIIWVRLSRKFNTPYYRDCIAKWASSEGLKFFKVDDSLIFGANYGFTK